MVRGGAKPKAKAKPTATPKTTQLKDDRAREEQRLHRFNTGSFSSVPEHEQAVRDTLNQVPKLCQVRREADAIELVERTLQLDSESCPEEHRQL